jgi:hypothetical protein
MITKIQEENGSIEIHEPTEEMIKRLQTILPFGMMILDESFEGAKYGIVMQCDEKEVHCLKLQPLEREREMAEKFFDIHNYLILHSYCQYIKNGFSGAYLASAYIRQRNNELWESGVAHFIFPSKNSSESPSTSNLWNRIFKKKERADELDDLFGKGTAIMFKGFMASFDKEYAERKVGEIFGKYFGLDYRPQSHLQNFAADFMVLDSQIVFLRANLHEYSNWNYLATQGIEKVYHLPSVRITN